jgi:hypothetical protein
MADIHGLREQIAGKPLRVLQSDPTYLQYDVKQI